MIETKCTCIQGVANNLSDILCESYSSENKWLGSNSPNPGGLARGLNAAR